MINLTRAVAIELAPDRIRVNCICPGGINTPLLHRGSPEAMGQLLDRAQPWPEHGRPEDIAARGRSTSRATTRASSPARRSSSTAG